VGTLQEVFEVLSSVDAGMRKFGVKFVYRNGRVLKYCTVVALGYLVAAFWTVWRIERNPWDAYGRLSLVSMFLTMWCVSSQLTLLNHYLESHMEGLKRILPTVRKSAQLESLLAMQTKLTKACHILNVGFGPRILATITTSFVSLLGGLYSTWSTFANYDGLLTILINSHQSITLAAFGIQIQNLVISCESTSKKACIYFNNFK
jgi:hypothetical protein